MANNIELDTLPFLYSKKSIVTSEVYDQYWKFAAERQNIFFNKIQNVFPWTKDEILSKYKFTNAYRASDRVSQFLLKSVIYNGKHYDAEDTIFRILLFKLFNKIETWECLENSLGDISYKSFSFEKYDQVLSNLLNNNERIYSAAYIMPSGKSSFGYDKKHRNNLQLLDFIMKDNISRKIARVQDMKGLYDVLLSYPTIGKFLAFQYCIDINYSELCDFSEMSFVVAGPGAQNGIAKCFISRGNYSEEDIIKFMAEAQEHEFSRLGIKFKSLWGRPLQLIDCQNLFCETDKYARVAFPENDGDSGRKRIKQIYNPSLLNHSIDYFYPPKWGINHLICKEE